MKFILYLRNLNAVPCTFWWNLETFSPAERLAIRIRRRMPGLRLPFYIVWRTLLLRLQPILSPELSQRHHWPPREISGNDWQESLNRLLLEWTSCESFRHNAPYFLSYWNGAFFLQILGERFVKITVLMSLRNLFSTAPTKAWRGREAETTSGVTFPFACRFVLMHRKLLGQLTICLDFYIGLLLKNSIRCKAGYASPH